MTALRIRQLAPGDPARAALEQRARGLFGLAQRLAWRARLPLVVVMCGVGGTGKSTLAAALAERSGLPHLGSDQVRKELSGIRAAERAPPRAYDREHTQRTYAELAARAAAAVRVARWRDRRRDLLRPRAPRDAAARSGGAGRPRPVGRVPGAPRGAAATRGRARARSPSTARTRRGR